MKKWFCLGGIILVLLLISLLRSCHKEYRVLVTGDDNISNNIVSKNNVLEIKGEPSKENYIFGGFVNSNGELVYNGLKISENMNLSIKWIPNNTVTISITYDIDGNKFSIKSSKNEKITPIITPIKKGYVFGGWILDGSLFDSNTLVNNDINLKARWVKRDNITVKVVMDDYEFSYYVEKGTIDILPMTPIKSGYVFDGWLTADGQTFDTDFKISSNVIIKPKWKKQYVCPSNCLPSSDGLTCEKTTTTNLVSANTCPTGYTLKNNKCLNYAKKYHADNTSSSWKCQNQSHYMYTEEDGSGGAFMWCVPTTAVSKKSTCPSGYSKVNNACQKKEILNCKES